MDKTEEALSVLIGSSQEVIGHFGAMNIEGKRRTWWSVWYDRSVTKLIDISDYKVAQILSVLGSETRLAILRHLLQNPGSVSEIISAVGLNTTGQAHHHLRELERAGYVEQRSGGRYHFNLSKGRVYLAALALAADVGALKTDED